MTKKSVDVLVAGGGLSGLTVAVLAAQAGLRVLVLDQSSVPGARFCLAGMGRGAVSNRAISVDSFYGRHARFVTDALGAFTPEKLCEWSDQLGLQIEEAPWYGILAPSLGGAALILALLDELQSARGELRTGCKVTAAMPQNDGFRVTLQSGEHLSCARLVLATGGLHLPQLGGKGGGAKAGYRIAAALGHLIETPFPAQVGLRIREAWPLRLPGLWMHVELTLTVNGRRRARSVGSILFTQSGLTGEAVFAVSREVGPALAEGGKVELALNFFPDREAQEVATMLFQTFGERVRQRASEALDYLIPQSLGDELLKLAGIRPEWRVERLEKVARNNLHQNLIQARLEITDTLGFRAAESTRGGVNVREVDPRSLESKLCPGLYIVGGILDVDGRWGGFDQHFALAAGHLAGRSVVGSR